MNFLKIERRKNCSYLTCNGVIIATITNGVTKAEVVSKYDLKKIHFDTELEYVWGIERIATLEDSNKYYILEAYNGFQEAAFINPNENELLMFVYRL